MTDSSDNENTQKSKIEETIRKRWTTLNQQWMGNKKFDELIEKKLHSHQMQYRHLSYLESNLGTLEGKNILDVGCGEGGFVVALKEKNLKALGVDISRDALEIAHLQLAYREHLGNPNIICQTDGHHLPFPDNSFDLITSIDTLEHIPNLEGFMREVQRTLRKGGYFYANTPNRHWPYETHCRMYFLHWVPYPLREPIIKSFFPKRLKKFAQMDFLRALNLLTPSETKELSRPFFDKVEDYCEVIMNRYENDRKNDIRKSDETKNAIIGMFLASRKIPAFSAVIKSLVGRYSPEIILLARK